MKTEKNILIAFILNLFFSVFEFFGGIFTGSVAIISDALHDLGDAASIGISYFLEKKSKTKPDKKYTYGYAGYSVLGSLITTSILLFGSGAVIYNAVLKLINPSEINYNGMLIFAVIGVIVNFIAALVTKDGDSLNQKAVNLHMLEDVLGWIVVLIGAVVMKFTDFKIIDPIMSIAVAIFILINALSNMKEILSLFFEKVPENINVEELEEHILGIEGVLGLHHIHIWSIDGQRIFATMHIVTNQNSQEIKKKVRSELSEHGISHATLELEKENENCGDEHCHQETHNSHHHHHHHHH
jgi:cobalt-zinc-cadmium efflux system protein